MRSTKKIRECSVEDYLCAKVKAHGGFALKNNPAWAIGVPDRTVGLLGYMCMVELKRPKGGRLSGAQLMWKKMLANAGTPWHLICTKDEVDAFIEMVRTHHENNLRIQALRD